MSIDCLAHFSTRKRKPSTLRFVNKNLIRNRSRSNCRWESVNKRVECSLPNKAGSIDVPSKCEKIKCMSNGRVLYDQKLYSFSAIQYAHTLDRWSGNFMDAPVMILSTLFTFQQIAASFFIFKSKNQNNESPALMNILYFDYKFKEEKKYYNSTDKSWKTFKKLNTKLQHIPEHIASQIFGIITAFSQLVSIVYMENLVKYFWMMLIIIISTKKVSDNLFFSFWCIASLHFVSLFVGPKEMTIYKLCGRAAFRRREWKWR